MIDSKLSQTVEDDNAEKKLYTSHEVKSLILRQLYGDFDKRRYYCVMELAEECY